MNDETYTLALDTSAFEAALTRATNQTQNFGHAFSRALEQSIIKGKDFETVLQSLLSRLSSMALDAAFKPIEQGISGTLNTLFSGMFQGAGKEIAPSIFPFAKGGVVSAPTVFGFGGGNMGLMGEAGSEAILPLSRGSDGRLGVRTQATHQAAPQITLNITTPDATGFKKSETQLTATLQRMIERGSKIR